MQRGGRSGLAAVTGQRRSQRHHHVASTWPSVQLMPFGWVEVQALLRLIQGHEGQHNADGT